TTGFGHSHRSASSAARRTTGSGVPPVMAAAVSLRSAPAEKTGPVCEITIARTASSATAAARAAARSSMRRNESALRFAGLFSVRVATARSTPTSTRAPAELVMRARYGRLGGMPSTLPDGEPVPADGALPAAATAEVGRRGFGVYVHVPFCAS